MRIPTYQKQVKPQRTVGGGIHIAPEPKAPSIGEAIAVAAKSAGDAVTRVAAQQDKVIAQDALLALKNKWRNSWMDDQANRQGRSAIGITKERGEVFSEDIDEIAGGIEGSERAKALYYEKAKQYKSVTLDKYARYESAQLQQTKKDAVDAAVQDAMITIDEGVTIEQFEAIRHDMDEDVDTLFPDPKVAKAEKYKIQKKLVGKFVMSEAMRDPGQENLQTLFKKYDKYLDDTDIAKISSAAEDRAVEVEVDFLSRVIEESSLDDPDGQLKMATDLAGKVDPRVSEKLIDRYEARAKTHEYMSVKAVEKATEDAMTAFVNARTEEGGPDFEAMQKVVEALTEVNPDRANNLQNLIDSLKRADLHKPIPLDEYRKAHVKLARDPRSLSREQIIAGIGTKWDEPHGNRLLSLKGAFTNEHPNPVVDKSLNYIDQLREAQIFDPSDALKNGRLADKLQSQLLDFYVENPDADIIKDFLDPKTYEYRHTWRSKWWDHPWDRTWYSLGLKGQEDLPYSSPIDEPETQEEEDAKEVRKLIEGD